MTQSNEPTVYIVSWQGQNVEQAKNFGRLKAITTGRIESFKLDRLSRLVHDALKDSQPGDWIVPTGHMILGILTAVEFIRLHNRVNFLIWHTLHQKYIPRIMHYQLGVDISEPVLKEILNSEVPLELP